MTDKQYAVGQRDIEQLDEGGYYTRHIYAMTHEGLCSKSDIAAELAHRDLQIDLMKTAGEEYTVVKMVNSSGSVYAFPTSDDSDGIIYEIVDGQPCRTTWMRFELLRAIEFKRAKVIGKAYVKLTIRYKQD